MSDPKHTFKVGDKVKCAGYMRCRETGMANLPGTCAYEVWSPDPLIIRFGESYWDINPIQCTLVEPAPEAKLPSKYNDIETGEGAPNFAERRDINALIDFCASLEARIKELER